MGARGPEKTVEETYFVLLGSARMFHRVHLPRCATAHSSQQAGRDRWDIHFVLPMLCRVVPSSRTDHWLHRGLWVPVDVDGDVDRQLKGVVGLLPP